MRRGKELHSAPHGINWAHIRAGLAYREIRMKMNIIGLCIEMWHDEMRRTPLSVILARSMRRCVRHASRSNSAHHRHSIPSYYQQPNCSHCQLSPTLSPQQQRFLNEMKGDTIPRRPSISFPTVSPVSHSLPHPLCMWKYMNMNMNTYTFNS